MWLFVVVGCMFILFGVFEFITYLMNKKYFDSEVTGIVIRLERNNSQTLPVYRYAVDGKVYETQLIPELYDKRVFQVEQSDALLYHVSNPEHIKLKRESYTMAYALFGGAIIAGTAVIVLAVNGILRI